MFVIKVEQKGCIYISLIGPQYVTHDTSTQKLHIQYSHYFTTLYFKTTLDFKTVWFGPKGQFSVLNNLYFKTTCNMRPHFLGPMGGLKLEGPPYLTSKAYFNSCLKMVCIHLISSLSLKILFPNSLFVLPLSFCLWTQSSLVFIIYIHVCQNDVYSICSLFMDNLKPFDFWGHNDWSIFPPRCDFVTLCPANDTTTYGSTRSFASPVKAFFTLAMMPVVIFGKPSALYIRIMKRARCLSAGTPSGNNRFLQGRRTHTHA